MKKGDGGGMKMIQTKQTKRKKGWLVIKCNSAKWMNGMNSLNTKYNDVVGKYNRGGSEVFNGGSSRCATHT